jgi:hypothetical protein
MGILTLGVIIHYFHHVCSILLSFCDSRRVHDVRFTMIS